MAIYCSTALPIYDTKCLLIMTLMNLLIFLHLNHSLKYFCQSNRLKSISHLIGISLTSTLVDMISFIYLFISTTCTLKQKEIAHQVFFIKKKNTLLLVFLYPLSWLEIIIMNTGFLHIYVPTITRYYVRHGG